MKPSLLLSLAATALFLVGCGSTPTPPPNSADMAAASGKPQCYVVKTTAYSHKEADSKPYGKLSAAGNKLDYKGKTRSAAADWSRYPVGTRFRIMGLPYTYVVDDYGSALVGTDTIDVYHPNKRKMNTWGAPTVGIEVIEWGSFKESLRILEPRARHAWHVRRMVDEIKAKTPYIPPRMLDGFPVTQETRRDERRGSLLPIPPFS